MKNWLIVAVVNDMGMFIFDTYNEYIIIAASKEDAEKIAMKIPHFKDVDSSKEIQGDSAAALIASNRTKKITDNITQIITL